MTDLIVKLNEELKKVAPIDGISVGRFDNKSTWRIDFDPEATSAQRRAAQDVVNSFDIIVEQQKLYSIESAKKAAKERIRQLPVDALLTRKDLEDAGLLE